LQGTRSRGFLGSRLWKQNHHYVSGCQTWQSHIFLTTGRCLVFYFIDLLDGSSHAHSPKLLTAPLLTSQIYVYFHHVHGLCPRRINVLHFACHSRDPSRRRGGWEEEENGKEEKGQPCLSVLPSQSYDLRRRAAMPAMVILEMGLILTFRLSVNNSIKREIGHLCHDERRPKPTEKQTMAPTPGDGAIDMTRSFAPGEFSGSSLASLN